MAKAAPLLFLLLVFSIVLCSGVQALERDGRWLKYNGTYPYLVGYDLQELFSKKAYSDSDIDYKLDQLQEFRVSAIRIWANTWFMGENGYYPWARDANGKFNLDSWDSTYWDRMKRFVQKCKDRGIIVEFVIFGEYPNNDVWWQGGSSGNYRISWNRNFNTNGIFSANSNGSFYPQFFNLDYTEGGASLADYQQALIDKSINELNGYGNVYFQVHNEFPAVWAGGSAISQVYPWQQHWADYIHSTKGAIVAAHAHEGSGMNLYGVDYFKGKSYVDALNFHYYSASSGMPLSGGNDNIDRISALLHSLQRTGQILQCDESHAFENPTYTDVDTREAWASFVSGAYYLHYQDTPDIIGNSAWRSNAERIKVLRNVADTISFWQMSPVDSSDNEYDSLISNGPASYWQVLANPGNEYVVYFSINPTSTSVSMSLPSGTYSYKYYDTRTWNANGIRNGTVTSSGGSTTIAVPSTSSWSGSIGMALVIKKSGGAAICNDAQCDSGECSTCPGDCTLSYCCGREGCNSGMGETCSTCPQDCGICPVPLPSGNWTKVADEGGTCVFDGTQEVWYGANDKYYYKTVPSGIACSNSIFGDPLVGADKACYIRQLAQQDIIAHYKMDETSGTTASDSSGNGNTGTLVNFPTPPTWTAGKIGNALSFDGSDDYVESANADNVINGLTEASVSVWLKSDVINTDRGLIIGNAPSGSDTGITLRYDAAGAGGGGTNVIKVGFGNGAGDDAANSALESSSNQQTTSWQHIVATWKANQAPRLFINGVEDMPSWTSNGGSSISNTAFLRIGQGSKDAASGWDGLIDDVRIYDRALTAQEILSLYQNGSCIHKSDTSQDGCVDSTELSAFIVRWQLDSSNPTVRELIEAIGLWKRGC